MLLRVQHREGVQHEPFLNSLLFLEVALVPCPTVCVLPLSPNFALTASLFDPENKTWQLRLAQESIERDGLWCVGECGSEIGQVVVVSEVLGSFGAEWKGLLIWYPPASDELSWALRKVNQLPLDNKRGHPEWSRRGTKQESLKHLAL